MTEKKKMEFRKFMADWMQRMSEQPGDTTVINQGMEGLERMIDIHVNDETSKLLVGNSDLIRKLNEKKRN